MKQHLPKFIHGDKTGSFGGTYIGQNKTFKQYIGPSRNFSVVDFKEAFDTLEWSFTPKTFETFDFGGN